MVMVACLVYSGDKSIHNWEQLCDFIPRHGKMQFRFYRKFGAVDVV